MPKRRPPRRERERDTGRDKTEKKQWWKEKYIHIDTPPPLNILGNILFGHVKWCLLLCLNLINYDIAKYVKVIEVSINTTNCTPQS